MNLNSSNLKKNIMLTVGDKFPEFAKQAVVSIEPGKEFKTLASSDLKNGKWTVFFWWPLDFNMCTWPGATTTRG